MRWSSTFLFYPALQLSSSRIVQSSATWSNSQSRGLWRQSWASLSSRFSGSGIISTVLDTEPTPCVQLMFKYVPNSVFKTVRYLWEGFLKSGLIVFNSLQLWLCFCFLFFLFFVCGGGGLSPERGASRSEERRGLTGLTGGGVWLYMNAWYLNYTLSSSYAGRRIGQLVIFE